MNQEYFVVKNFSELAASTKIKMMNSYMNTNSYMMYSYTVIDSALIGQTVTLWISENQSKLHIISFEINSFKLLYSLPREISMHMKFTHSMHQFIIF